MLTTKALKSMDMDTRLHEYVSMKVKLRFKQRVSKGKSKQIDVEKLNTAEKQSITTA